MKRNFSRCVALVVLAMLGWTRAGAVDLSAEVKADAERLSQFPSRLMGSPGHAAARILLAERIGRLANATLVRQPFPLMIPDIHRAEMTVADGDFSGTHPIYPVWPDSVRLKTTPAEGLAGETVYIGHGDYRGMPADSLRGAIVAVEMSAYREETWLRAFEFGAQAVLLLGSPDDTAAPPYFMSIYKPRYYIPDGPLANAVRAGTLGRVTLHCDGQWSPFEAENLLAMVPGTDPSLRPIILAARYDAMSVIPGLAPGADNAVDTAFLLRMLEHLSAHPPRRGVVVAFVDGFGFNLLGMRELMAMLSIVPDDLTRKAYEQSFTDQLADYEAVAAQVEELGADYLSALPQLADRKRFRTLQRYTRDALSPEMLAIREELFELRLAEVELTGEEAKQAMALKEEKLERKAELDSILSAILAQRDLPEAFLAECAEVWATIRRRTFRQLAELREQIALFEEYDAVRAKVLDGMGIEPADSVLFPFVFGIDLSDGGTQLGPAFKCEALFQDYSRSGRQFSRWLRNILRDSDNPYARLPGERLAALGLEADELPRLAASVLNRESVVGGINPASLSLERMALITGVAGSFQATGVTWTALEGVRLRLDTPQDTFERLNWARLEPQIRMTAWLVDMLLNDDSDESFVPDDNQARGGTFPGWRLPDGVVVSESVAETIARTPSPDMLVTSLNHRMGRAAPAFRGQEFIVSGADGRFRFRPGPTVCAWPARNRFLRAYTLAEDGRIVQAIAEVKSMLTTAGPAMYQMHRNPPLTPLRAEIFDCVEVNGPVFRDPRYQARMSGGRVQDVNRGGPPKRFFWNDVEGPMFGLLRPETRFQLILGMGGGKNRMALLNVPEDFAQTDKPLREGLRHGFEAGRPLPTLPELISARDFFQIDEWRLSRLEGAGVNCKPIRELHVETGKRLELAEQAYAIDDGEMLKRAATLALASEIRVYQAVLDLADDVTRGAIFLLLLLVPFSIAMERLLFASPAIGQQIGKTMAIFVVMFIILSSFHPGFKITTMPAVILIAFMVLMLSVSVIGMIMKKFRADMEELRRGTLAEASGAQTGRRGVVISAVWLGIANMRKRFVRTLLTGLTIVLVTFSLLCFTSSSTYQNKRTTTLSGVVPSHAGVLLQHPSSHELDHETDESVATMLGDASLVVSRHWVVDTTIPEWRLHLRNATTGQLAPVKAGLILDAREDRFSRVAEVLGDWEAFAAGDGCYVSNNTALRLGIEAGQRITVAGVELTVIDVFDAQEFETTVRKLDGQPLLPIDYSVQADNWALGGGEALESAMATGGIIEPDPQMVFVSGDDVIILPVGMNRVMEASLRSVVIFGPEDDSDSEGQHLADRLVREIAYPVYYGTENQVRAIVSTPLIPKAPRNLLIPILIAALIIFNTMLNSIAERKKEIYIYSSLGLAPRHIGVLFLAEALTYGVMGSVFGYVIGQGVATVLTHYDLMGGITLNYSGSNVIMTMGLVLLVVILSALVPAYMAAKVASPSGDLDWKVPTPKDGVIHGPLPFTVSRQAAPGLAAFLCDYLRAHGDGAIGNFTSDETSLEGGDGKTVVSLTSTIWPAPYDLGVRQRMTVRFEGSESDICDLKIHLEHEAGPERSWWRLNRVFIGNLRAQLLGWRNISPERMVNYIRQAENDERRARPGATAN